MPFRLGTTSYILPADLLANVRYLTGKVQDVEILLLEVKDETRDLPSLEVVEELAALAKEHDLSYTVHLPLDLRLGDPGEEGRRSLQKACAVITRTCPLDPQAYVLHLNGNMAVKSSVWLRGVCEALQLLTGCVRTSQRLAVENTEGVAHTALESVLARLPVGRCVDVGHLWLDGHDPLPHLRVALPRARVIHLHGVGLRDHQSLALVPEVELRRVVSYLLQEDYAGVVTVEVFAENDFLSSMEVLDRMMRKP